MLSRILGLTLLLNVPSYSRASVSCAEVFLSGSSKELLMQKILGKLDQKTQSLSTKTGEDFFQFRRLKDFKIPNVQISHALFYPDEQLMLIEIDTHGKKALKNLNGSQFKDHEVALVDLRSGHIVSLSSQFRNMDEIDASTFENSGIVQPRLNSKNQLVSQLLIEPKKKMSQHADLRNMLPYQTPLIGALNIEQFRMARSAFPLRDRLINQDTFLMIPEKNPADLTQLQNLDPSIKTINSFQVALGVFDHSSPHNFYRAVPQRKLEKSQNLFLYPREEDIQNYTLNSRFFAGMVKEDQLKVRIWSSHNGKILKDLPAEVLGHFEPDQALSFYSSHEGRLFVIRSNDTILILNGETFEIQDVRQTPNHFLNQIVFSNSENSIAFQDKFHVFVWHTGDQNHSSSNHMKTRVDLFSTNGVSQWISLPSDTVVLMLPIFPHLSQTNNNDPTEMTREKLEEQLGLRPSAHRWRAYKAGGQNEWNPLIELANPTDKPAKHFTSMLPADFPATAQSAGNNTFFSFSNHSDGLDQFVLIKVWTKTIETTFSN